LLDRPAQADTTPGTVTESQPVFGMLVLPAKRSGVHALGARPEALNPCRRVPSQTSAKASEPIPFMVGSTTVSVIAVASAASIALPPFLNICNPACAASGCEVATALCASTGMRCEA
jgi:hypothetical protein